MSTTPSNLPTPEPSDVLEFDSPAVPSDGSPAVDISYDDRIPPRKFWHAGTLKYSFGGLAALFCWLLWGDLAWSIRDRTVGSIAQVLLVNFKASNFLIGLFLTSIPPFISIFLSPVISFKSDRHRGRWGRRIPFLLIPTPIAALSMLGLAFTSTLGARLHEAVGSNLLGPDQANLVVFGFFWILYDVSTIVASAVFYPFVNDVVPRPVLGRFFGLFRAISLIVGIIFQGALFGKLDSYFARIFIGISLIYGVGFTLMCIFVKEGEYPPPEPIAPALGHSGFAALARIPFFSHLAPLLYYLRECFAMPYYLWIFAIVIFSNLSYMPINTFNYPFAQSLGMSKDWFGKLMAFYFCLSLLQTVPLGWLVDKFHPLRVGMVALVFHAAASLYGGLLIHNQFTFGIAFVLTGTISGTWYTATAALTMTLFPKLKFAQYSSAMNIIVAITGMIYGPAFGKLLDLTHSAYRLTYLAGFFGDVITLVLCWIVYRNMRAHGGPKAYVAPE